MDNGQWTMDNGQWTMDKADILQPVDQWTIDNLETTSHSILHHFLANIFRTTLSKDFQLYSAP
ncbi:MAG: hypothetical protein LBB49_00700 [Gracilibacteraceae bacterium]|nr:hypothetical protein [Gracilibacteraceae bacterium]